MKSFKSKEDLLEAVAQNQHNSNMTVGGVFDKEGNRFSDIDVERRVAANYALTFVSPDYAKALGKPAGWHFRNFGYVPYCSK
jgi:hypothetical protein